MGSGPVRFIFCKFTFNSNGMGIAIVPSGKRLALEVSILGYGSVSVHLLFIRIHYLCMVGSVHPGTHYAMVLLWFQSTAQPPPGETTHC